MQKRLFGQIRVFNDGDATLKAIKAQRMVKGYLRSHFIPFTEDQEDGTHRITILYKGCNTCPSGILESCIPSMGRTRRPPRSTAFRWSFLRTSAMSWQSMRTRRESPTRRMNGWSNSGRTPSIRCYRRSSSFGD